MRFLELNPAVESRLLASRRRRDAEAARVAARIVADVRRRGDRGLLYWARRLEGHNRDPGPLQVERSEWRAARRGLDPTLLDAIRRARRNIRRVARRQLPRPWSLRVEPGVEVGQLVRPLGSVGCYVPGGRFSLVSTLLMTAVPARVAGVQRLVIVCPRPDAAILATCDLLGVDALYRAGGAQAVAALAYGTESIPPVDKITGPGNRYVAAAKTLVASDCGIDLVAGPTELIVLARRGNPRYMAADLLAQAEHDPEAVVLLVTTSRALGERVQAEVGRQLRSLPTGNPARASIRRHGAVLLAPSISKALAFVNRFAAEHVSLPEDAAALVEKVDSAGSLFLGPWSAQPLGDFATGSNHTLPTGGWARLRGGLSAAEFVKCFSVQRVSRQGLRALAPAAVRLASAEGLEAHRRAVEVRR